MREIHETTSLGNKAKSGSRNIAKHRLRNQNHVKIKQQQQNKQIKQQKIHDNEVKTRNAIARLLSRWTKRLSSSYLLWCWTRLLGGGPAHSLSSRDQSFRFPIYYLTYRFVCPTSLVILKQFDPSPSRATGQ